MTGQPMAVELLNVSAGYRGNIILKNITLNIGVGCIAGISGPNGSGKTTLLKVIQGMLPVKSGAARIMGLDFVSANCREIQRKTACVFQTLNIDPRMPILAGEVVMMGRYGRTGLIRRIGQSDRKAAERALELVDGTHLSDRPFGQLSGGEQQRINLARALAQEPELLLLDEPTTFLDVESQQRVKDIIKSIHKQTNLTTIIVSHDANMLKELCSQIVVMRRGCIVETISSRDFANA